MDIESIRYRAEFLALEALVVSLIRAFIATSPSSAEVFRQKVDQLREKLVQSHPKGTSAEQGDLLSAELQDAWDRLIQQVLQPKP